MDILGIGLGLVRRHTGSSVGPYVWSSSAAGRQPARAACVFLYRKPGLTGFAPCLHARGDGGDPHRRYRRGAPAGVLPRLATDEGAQRRIASAMRRLTGIRVRRRFAASAQRVFGAWLDPRNRAPLAVREPRHARLRRPTSTARSTAHFASWTGMPARGVCGR
jgi:hypothetical protein